MTARIHRARAIILIDLIKFYHARPLTKMYETGRERGRREERERENPRDRQGGKIGKQRGGHTQRALA